VPNRVAEHTRVLAGDVEVRVRMEFCRGRLDRYAVVLVHHGRAVRSFDNAHGQHDVHRYDEQGQQLPAEKFIDGTVQQGLDAALTYLQESWERIIES
jgi:hypothetical protein